MPDFGRWANGGGDPSLNEVNRTDRFLDSLANEQPVYSTDSGEAELAYLLAGWRDDVRQAPATSVLTTRDAVAALDRSAGSRQRRRVSMAVLGSVAAGVLAVGGLGGLVAGAGPDDPLYGLRTALFGEPQKTRDDQVVLAAQTQLAEVQQLIDQGDWAGAQSRLQTMTTTVAAVDDTARQQELVQQWQQLQAKVETRDVNATVPPGAPEPVLPEIPSDLPLPVILDPNTSPYSVTSPPTTPTLPGPSDVPTLPGPSDVPTSPSTPPGSGEPTPSPVEPGPSSSPVPTPTPQPSPRPTPQPSPRPSPTPQPQPSPTPQPQPTPRPLPTTTTFAPPVQLPPAEEPQAEQPSAEEPPAQAPVAEAPVVEAPVVEVPQQQAPPPRLSGGSPGSAPAVQVPVPPVVEVPDVLLPGAGPKAGD